MCIGIKYMLTNNIDVSNGLVNGACGIQNEIIFEKNSKEILKLWIDFNNDRVGKKARDIYKQFASDNNINEKLTPILKQQKLLPISELLGYQVIRIQFPVVAGEAITIHKSQGQTYNNVCLDLRHSQRITTSMMYVALSRTKELNGLHIIGEFYPPVELKTENPILEEMKRLKTEKLLQLSFNNLINVNGRIIIYLNANSFKKHATKIIIDP